jgi:hypothetical protein
MCHWLRDLDIQSQVCYESHRRTIHRPDGSVLIAWNPGNNPESHKSSGQVLVNAAETRQVKIDLPGVSQHSERFSRKSIVYFSFAYSEFASMRTGTSGSASRQSVRKSL